MHNCMFLLVLACQAFQSKPVDILAGVQLGMSLADSANTQAWLASSPNHYEVDPIARPFVHNGAIAYGLDIAGTVATAWVASRMRRSHNRVVRRLWWLPQSLVIAGNTEGIVYSSVTAAHERR